MDKLKPCPFCGGEAKLNRQITPLGKKQWTVKCDCGVLFHYRNRRWKAIEAWNRRASDVSKNPT